MSQLQIPAAGHEYLDIFLNFYRTNLVVLIASQFNESLKIQVSQYSSRVILRNPFLCQYTFFKIPVIQNTPQQRINSSECCLLSLQLVQVVGGYFLRSPISLVFQVMQLEEFFLLETLSERDCCFCAYWEVRSSLNIGREDRLNEEYLGRGGELQDLYNKKSQSSHKTFITFVLKAQRNTLQNKNE